MVAKVFRVHLDIRGEESVGYRGQKDHLESLVHRDTKAPVDRLANRVFAGCLGLVVKKVSRGLVSKDLKDGKEKRAHLDRKGFKDRKATEDQWAAWVLRVRKAK